MTIHPRCQPFHTFSLKEAVIHGVSASRNFLTSMWMPLTIRNHFIHPIAFIFSFPPVSLCLIIHICKVYIFSFHVAPIFYRIFPLFCHHIYHFHFLTFFLFNSHWVWLAPRAPTSHIFSSSPKNGSAHILPWWSCAAWWLCTFAHREAANKNWGRAKVGNLYCSENFLLLLAKNDQINLYGLGFTDNWNSFSTLR